MTPTPAEVRKRIVAWAHWHVAHKGQIAYEEVRPFRLGTRLPMENDCSATFTNCYYLGGAPDPNGPAFHYDGYGNTDSLATHGQMLDSRHPERTLPGDAVIYYEGAYTVHVALIVDPGEDPMTMSHGWSGEPSLVRVSEDGRPHQFFRFPTNYRF